jgi:hypothetical protein
MANLDTIQAALDQIGREMKTRAWRSSYGPCRRSWRRGLGLRRPSGEPIQTKASRKLGFRAAKELKVAI